MLFLCYLNNYSVTSMNEEEDALNIHLEQILKQSIDSQQKNCTSSAPTIVKEILASLLRWTDEKMCWVSSPLKSFNLQSNQYSILKSLLCR